MDKMIVQMVVMKQIVLVFVSVKGISHLRHSFVVLDPRLMETYAQLLVPAQALHSVLSKTTLLVQINSWMVEVLN